MFEYQQMLAQWITDNLGIVILSLMVGLLLALIIFIIINIRLGKLNRKYEKMMKGSEGQNLEQILFQHISEVRSGLEQVRDLDQRCRALEEKNLYHIQKVGMVRFNAFEDTGSDLSFAVAMLNESDTGFVLSSIFGRQESRVYAKPVKNGESSYFLTEEEKEAIRRAQNRQDFRQA